MYKYFETEEIMWKEFQLFFTLECLKKERLYESKCERLLETLFAAAIGRDASFKFFFVPLNK